MDHRPVLRWLSTAALDDALTQPLVRPPKARVRHATRSTISSLHAASRIPSPTILTSPPAVLSYSPPNRSSIDSLRSLTLTRSASSSTFPVSDSTQFTSWWGSDRENLDTADDHQISKKCLSCAPNTLIYYMLTYFQIFPPKTLLSFATVFLASIRSLSVPLLPHFKSPIGAASRKFSKLMVLKS